MTTGTVDGSLIFDTHVDTDGFSRGANNIRKEAISLKGVLSSLAKYVSFAFVGAQLVNLGKQAIDTASDLAEVQNVVDTSFGSMAYKMEEFADNCIEAYGISKLTAKQTGSTFMAMSKSMGLSAGSASDMSIALTGLSADLASFYNVSSDVAATALKSIFTGETETLKQFGIVMTEANLQEYALSQGISKSVQNMTQAEKVTLRYNYVMKNTAIAQGDFAKTSQSWSNQTKILKEQFKELLSTLGTGLIQILIPALRALNSVLSSLISIANAVGEIFNGLFGTEAKTYTMSGQTADGAQAVADSIGAIGDSAKESAAKTDKAMASFDKIEKIGSSTATENATATLSDTLDSMGATSNTLEATNSLADSAQTATEGMNGLSTAIIGIGSTIAAVKLAPKIAGIVTAIGGLGPGGVIAACGIGLGLLAGYLYTCWKDAKATDLEGRFGDIVLSAYEINSAAQAIVDNGSLNKIATTIQEWSDLEDIFGVIQGAVDEINKLNWKINVGMELSEGEIAQYKQAVATYISNIQKYCDNQAEAVLLSLDVLIEDSEQKSTLIQGTKVFYDNVKSELTDLGSKLNQAVNDGWADGLLDIDEQAEIAQIQEQMNNIYTEMEKAEYTANLESIKIKFSGADLSPDTFKALEKQIDETVQEYTNSYDETMELTIQALQFRLANDPDFDQSEYNAAIEEIKKNRFENIGEINLNATRFSITSLTDAFDKEIGTAVPDMKQSLQTTIDTLFNSDDMFTLPNFWSGLELKFNQGFEKLEGVAASNLQDLLELMAPSKTQLEALANEAKANGEVVPESIAEGLISIAQLEAMAGNVSGLYTLIGSYISDNPSKLALLDQAKQEGMYIPQEIYNGIALGKYLPAESITDLFRMIGITAEEQSKILNSQMRDKGKTVIDKFKAGLISGKETALQIVKDMYAELAALKVPTMPTVGINMALGSGSRISIPAYASGNVIPANYGNFLATLGDNKKEPEVVSPVSTIKQAVQEVLQSGNYGAGTQTTILELDGVEFARASYNYSKAEQNRIGVSFVKGGDH